MNNPFRSSLKLLANGVRRRMQTKAARDVHAILDGTPIRMLDVGAAGGILPRWAPYRGDISFIGLEPDERSSADLLASPEAGEFQAYRIIGFGAWSRVGTVDISFTRKPTCSSHFQPNTAFLRRFPDAQRFEVVGKGEVKCRTLDDLLSGEQADFIKLDLEGGELEVLRGGSRVLEGVLGLHVEVAFHPLRVGQPLFGDVTTFLAERGQEFVDFLFISRWERDAFRNVGQAVFADAHYLAAPESVKPEGAKAYLGILLIYERYDLAIRFLDVMKTSRNYRDADYLKGAREIVLRRRRSFDKRFYAAWKWGLAAERIAAADSSFHYMY